MRSATMAAVAALTLTAGACAPQTGAMSPQGITMDHLDRAAASPHRYTYTERTEEQRVEVSGVVEDDLRRSAIVRVDGSDTLEMVISDDAVALRVLDPEFTIPLQDAVLERALAEGRWVIDYTAAPPLFAALTREGTVAFGQNPVLDAIYVFQYTRGAIDASNAVSEHSPDALAYVRQDDPFADLTEDELSRAHGYRRFDTHPPRLPGRAERGTDEAVPSTEHFRKLSLFLKGRDLAYIAEEISFERTEFRRAREGRESERYLEMLESVRDGHTREPVRLRQMSYEITDLGRREPVQFPADGVVGDLSDLFGSVRTEGPLPDEEVLPDMPELPPEIADRLAD